MLAHTLCHIPRISPKKEQELWAKGVHSWNSYRPLTKHQAFLDDCEKELQRRNPAFFADNLKADQHWRLFGVFRDSVAYVDIETTGLDRYGDEITTIALYDGRQVRTYVNGRNLNDFRNDIVDYKLLVTFNGKCFDLPFIQRYFGIELLAAHIDLRYVLKRLGYAGGLKQIEREVGIDRGDLRDVDGFLAVTLWHEYKRTRNEAALTTLLAYNAADVINLERLMILAYNLNVAATPFGQSLELANPLPAQNPFTSDAQLVKRLSW